MRLEPGPSIEGQTTGRCQIVHMWVVNEITGPGLQDTDQTDLTTDQAWIFGQLLDRLRGSVEEQVIDQSLVTKCQVTEFGGQREGQ